MSTYRSASKLLVPIAGAVLCGAFFLPAADATPPGMALAPAAVPAFQSAPASLAFLPVPIVPPALGPGLPSSVIPPNPAPGMVCSVDTAGGACSANAQGQLCSAQNNNGNQCSTFGGQMAQCSAAAANATCSVLPPISSQNLPSQCSTFAQDLPQECSAIAFAVNQRCSAKSRGDSRCSTHQTPQGGEAQCSVLNPGATQRSFCSTKFNVPEVSKLCSALSGNSRCSVILGGAGVCTTFGMADPNSCSAFAASSVCSVLGGPMGNPCAQ